MKKVRNAAMFAVAVLVALALPAPASAAVTPVWHASGSVDVVDSHSVKLNRAKADDWASYEAKNLGLSVSAGNAVSVEYELTGGATPDAGAVRLFIYDKPNADTMKDAPTQYVWAEGTKGTLTITADFTGMIGTAGLVYDTSNSSTGTVSFSNMKVNGFTVDFKDTTGEPDPQVVDVTKLPEPKYTEPTCAKAGSVVLPSKASLAKLGVAYAKNAGKGKVTVEVTALPGYKLSEAKTFGPYAVAKLTGQVCESPSPEPTTASPTPGDTEEPTTEPTPSVSTSPAVAGGSGNLPVTGSKVLGVAGVGGLLVAAGGLLFVWARRRRDQVPGGTDGGDTQVFPAV